MALWAVAVGPAVHAADGRRRPVLPASFGELRGGRTPGGLLRVDQAAIARETNLDGKYLLRTSDLTLSTEDIALGYKQLLEVVRGWRTMNQVIDMRPVYHRKEDRIRAPT
ncbi:hypothetical protein [Dactylosporangium sp. NPDC049140]|uniref:hypothetical protein n=1 Tax=Dactylosporangium sp. NPDC049140 TaxID=3155647 RepID=UPI003406CCE1